MSDEWFTPDEVAARLKVTRQAVYNWIKDGRLRAYRAARATRIPESAIVEFLQRITPGDDQEIDDD